MISQQWLYDAVLLIYRFVQKLSPKYFCSFAAAKCLLSCLTFASFVGGRQLFETWSESGLRSIVFHPDVGGTASEWLPLLREADKWLKEATKVLFN